MSYLVSLAYVWLLSFASFVRVDKDTGVSEFVSFLTSYTTLGLQTSARAKVGTNLFLFSCRFSFLAVLLLPINNVQ